MYLKLMYLICIHQTVAANSVHLEDIRQKREMKTILDEPHCGDIRTICDNLSEKDDLLILECLQSINPARLQLNEDCQTAIWEHTRQLLQNSRVKDILIPKCQNDLTKLSCNIDDEAEGSYLRCIINNRDNIENYDCNNLVLRLETVVFQEAHWLLNFLQHCSEDVKRLKCGRSDTNSFSQGDTITCLQNKILSVKAECKSEIFKLAEIQSDSIKLDKQLYLDCADDHRRYCAGIHSGTGKVITCLMHVEASKLTSKCAQQLLRRQKLIVQDYRVSRGLMRACREDIKKTHCRRQTSGDKTVRLAQILLCLENVVRNGTRIDSECEAEMIDHRRMLMEDYRLSPEIVDGCKVELTKFCPHLELGGKTIHCLMDHAMPKNREKVSRIGDQCQRALEGLIKQVDAGENWTVDPVLHQACYPVVKVACKGLKGGDARIMSCLMDNIGTDHMIEECEDALMQIQYFIARDFNLDPQLYRACRDDAVKKCHADKEWSGDENGVSNDAQVLPCLYRYASHPEENMQLNKSCVQHLRRIMRQRAISVDLQPEIEEVCLDDLGHFCHDKTKKGEEMMCLQNNLEDLEPKCHDAVEDFTEAEGEHAELNPYIMKHCPREMETLCSAELKNDEGDVMECLIAHKNDPLVKANQPCRGSIEHFQLISIKDYKFTYKFKMACKTHAMRLCAQSRTKSEVVACLSEKILNATVHGVKSVIPKECRQQLKAQLFQQRENIEYDPVLKKACSEDIKKHCEGIKPGNAEVLECLQSVNERLSSKCEQEIFKVKKQEAFDNTVDYALATICADAIDTFCPHHERKTVFDCLKRHRDEQGFDKKCRLIVMHRIVEQNSNYQLNPSLQQNCKMDISKFCKQVVQTSSSKDMNGPVIKCLKEAFKQSKLSNKCENEMTSILRDQALDIRLNPLLRAVCKNELETICNSEGEEAGDDIGEVEECLRNALLNKKIATPECQVEVANMIDVTSVDIHIDPLLQKLCSLDLLTLCHDVPQGKGRHIKCLRLVMENNPSQLSSGCKLMLSQRLEMYKTAALKLPPEDMNQLYNEVVASPSKHYFFLMLFIIVGSIFVIGIFCGRVTRRHTLLKNK